MSSADDERRIERDMRTLRAADEATCPSFAGTLAAARARGAHPGNLRWRSRRLWLGLAAAVVVGAVLALVLARTPDPGTRVSGPAPHPSAGDLPPLELEDALALASRPFVGPLDSLLDLPASDLLTTAPRFDSALPAYGAESWKGTAP